MSSVANATILTYLPDPSTVEERIYIYRVASQPDEIICNLRDSSGIYHWISLGTGTVS